MAEGFAYQTHDKLTLNVNNKTNIIPLISKIIVSIIIIDHIINKYLNMGIVDTLYLNEEFIKSLENKFESKVEIEKSFNSDNMDMINIFWANIDDDKKKQFNNLFVMLFKDI